MIEIGGKPRKNLERLVSAFIEMKAQGLLGDRTLVLVGKRGCKYRRLEYLLEHSGAKQVLPLGHVPDEHLPPLYGGADIFVCPSLYEGFGIPVLEARACGARVVASDIPELREAGGSDAIYAQPTTEGIRSGILRAVEQPKGPSTAFVPPTWREGAEIPKAEGTLTRVEPQPVPVSMLVNDSRVDLLAVYAPHQRRAVRGVIADDPALPIVLRWRLGDSSKRMIRISYPSGSAPQQPALACD